MSQKFLFFIFMVWAGVALASGIGDFFSAGPDTTDLNTLASGELIEVQADQFNSNPANAAIGAWKFAQDFFTAFYRMASFATPYWSGDLQVVRYMLLATLGLSALVGVGWETLRWLRG